MLHSTGLQNRCPPHASRFTPHRMMRLLLTLLILVLILLQYRFWFGDGGLTELWQLQRTTEKQQQEIIVLKERNETLEAEVIDLKQGLAAIEERARSDLGMIKDDETFYQAITEP